MPRVEGRGCHHHHRYVDQPGKHHFDRARQVRSSVLLEDYAKLIAGLLATGGEARTVDIARRMGVAYATAIKMIARLKRGGARHRTA